MKYGYAMWNNIKSKKLTYKTECQPIKCYIKNIKKPYEFIFDDVSFKYPGVEDLS